jgi:acetyl-CoA acetyltransferase
MAQQGRPVSVIGVGLHNFGRFPKKTFLNLSSECIVQALDDAGMENARDIQAMLYSHALPQTQSAGELVLAEVGMSAIPVINAENACSSSSSAVWLANKLISAGVYDIMLVCGTEKMPTGPLDDMLKVLPDRYLGIGLIMAQYAMRCRRYMWEYGATIESIAQVSVKSHHWGISNPCAQFKKETTIADVLNARMIADPITLMMCSPTGEGSASVILCATDKISKYSKSKKAPIKIAGSALVSSHYKDGTQSIFFEHTQRAGQEAMNMAGVTPADIDLAELHDAATIAELMRAESLGLIPKGEAWKWTIEGKTERDGQMPLNMSGGLKACGHPLAATGARQIVEVVQQLRGEAGGRQVPNAKIGLTETAGFGGVACVHILKKE